MFNRHWHVVNDDITRTRISRRFDLLTCVSVLEHISDYNSAVEGMFSLLNPGGMLVITCPYSRNAYHHNVYEIPGSDAYGKSIPYRTQSYSPTELAAWCAKNGANVVEQEHWQFWDGEYWSTGRQILPGVQVRSTEKHQLTCVLLKKT